MNTKIYTVEAPSGRLEVSLQLPSSKSISNRLLIMQALSDGKIRIKNLSASADTAVLQKALTAGAGEINVGHTGTAMRFLAAYLAVTEGEYLLTGSARMLQRPIGKLVDALKQLGADIQYVGAEGFPPLRIRGKKLRGKYAEIDGSTSSQFISALLMIAPVLPEGLTLVLTGTIISVPYIDLTLRLMQMAGITVSRENNIIRIPPQEYQAADITVEPDWSSASYWYSIAALAPDCHIFIRDLSAGSLQGDATIAHYFEELGVRTEYFSEGARLMKQPVQRKRFMQDFSDTPDMVQTFVVCLGLLGITFRISGARSLRIKETDRIAALMNEMKKLGIHLREPEEGVIEWDGSRSFALPGNLRFSTYQDHRMAMAFAPVCLACSSVEIEDPDVVEKSYPTFWEDLKKAGFRISMQPE